MLFKSMGLDVEAIKAQVIQFQANLAAVVKNFDDRLVLIETRLAKQEEILLQMQHVSLALLSELQKVSSETRPAGVGATQELLLHGRTDSGNPSGGN